MELATLYETMNSLWTVWFFALFAGIVAWALWPSRKSALERHARIPLDD